MKTISDEDSILYNFLIFCKTKIGFNVKVLHEKYSKNLKTFSRLEKKIIFKNPILVKEISTSLLLVLLDSRNSPKESQVFS